MMNKRINILYLCATTEIGGAERILLDIVQGLEKNLYSLTLVAQNDGELPGEFKRSQGKVYFLKMPAWRKTRNFLVRYWTVYRISRIAKKEKIDLIHCNSYRLNPYALWVSRITKIPFVTHVHDFLEKSVF